MFDSQQVIYIWLNIHVVRIHSELDSSSFMAGIFSPKIVMIPTRVIIYHVKGI